ncbi:MAG TPA: NAD-dependent epimerase/dehydratase family protein [Deltaproteobacteria bacterium]|nr:NAD-dependent epimerase/dehydratase family protein [Deltaproteobacteria bacterium]
MIKIVITGAAGFIGSALCEMLSYSYTVVGLDTKETGKGAFNCVESVKADITDKDSVSYIIEEYLPDVVIHCAGIAHQKIGRVDPKTYMSVNGLATENLARVAARANPKVQVMFLSSVSVYGEDNLRMPVTENSICNPSSDYAVSKYDAERRLVALFDQEKLNDLIILRLAPVYNRFFGLNLERRVFAPGKLTYLHFGSGDQKMSALARDNLIDFIEHLLKRTGEPESSVKNMQIYNVCDEQPYTFQRIIQVFKKSGVYRPRPSIHIPLFFIWISTRIAGHIFHAKRSWWHACYDKLASDLVYDNTRMLKTGFRPRHSLETLFCNERGTG